MNINHMFKQKMNTTVVLYIIVNICSDIIYNYTLQVVDIKWVPLGWVPYAGNTRRSLSVMLNFKIDVMSYGVGVSMSELPKMCSKQAFLGQKWVF